MVFGIINGYLLNYQEVTPTYLYKPWHSSWIICLVLAVLFIPVLKDILKDSKSGLTSSNPNLPGRDTFMLEKPYSHPNEVFVPFSVRVSKSPLVRCLVVLICLALVFFPLQLVI